MDRWILELSGTVDGQVTNMKQESECQDKQCAVSRRRTRAPRTAADAGRGIHRTVRYSTYSTGYPLAPWDPGRTRTPQAAVAVAARALGLGRSRSRLRSCGRGASRPRAGSRPSRRSRGPRSGGGRCVARSLRRTCGCAVSCLYSACETRVCCVFSRCASACPCGPRACVVNLHLRPCSVENDNSLQRLKDATRIIAPHCRPA